MLRSRPGDTITSSVDKSSQLRKRMLRTDQLVVQSRGAQQAVQDQTNAVRAARRREAAQALVRVMSVNPDIQIPMPNIDKESCVICATEYEAESIGTMGIVSVFKWSRVSMGLSWVIISGAVRWNHHKHTEDIIFAKQLGTFGGCSLC